MKQFIFFCRHDGGKKPVYRETPCAGPSVCEWPPLGGTPNCLRELCELHVKYRDINGIRIALCWEHADRFDRGDRAG